MALEQLQIAHKRELLEMEQKIVTVQCVESSCSRFQMSVTGGSTGRKKDLGQIVTLQEKLMDEWANFSRAHATPYGTAGDDVVCLLTIHVFSTTPIPRYRYNNFKYKSNQ